VVVVVVVLDVVVVVVEVVVLEVVVEPQGVICVSQVEEPLPSGGLGQPQVLPQPLVKITQALPFHCQ